MDPEDQLPDDILWPLIKAQNAYVPLVNAALLLFTLLVCRVKGGSCLLLANLTPNNGSNRAGIVSPRHSLGSLFSAGWWPPTPLLSWSAEISDKHKSVVEETLVPISRWYN